MSKNASSIALNIAIRSDDFRDRIKFFVISESASAIVEDPLTVGHTQRFAYAETVLAGSVDFSIWSIAVASDASVFAALQIDTSTIGDDVADNLIQSAVAALFNAFAGVSK